MTVSEAIIAVTSRCNAKCLMCDIWKSKKTDEVEPTFYYNLPQSLKQVNITGGEPFLRKDLLEIVTVVSDRCRGVRPVISTNGLLTERILKTAPSLLTVNSKTAYRISIDGIGQTHDRIRGIPGAYEKAMATVEGLKKLNVRDLGIAFTLVRNNQEEMLQVHDLARSSGVEFTYAVAHSSPIFFGEQENSNADPDVAENTLNALMIRQLKSSSPKDWFRAYFTAGLIDWVKGHKRKVLCPALDGFFFLDPQGTVFPCHVLNEAVGKLKDDDYDRLIEKAGLTPDSYRHCREQCWMICTVAPEMRRHPMPVAWWIAKKKAKLFIGGGGQV